MNNLTNQLIGPLFDNHQDAILIVNPDHDVCYTNLLASSKKSAEVAHVFCQTKRKINHPELINAVSSSLNKAKHQHVMIDAEKFTLTPIKYEHIPCCLVQFKAAEFSQKNLLSRVKLAMCVFDENGLVLESNDYFNSLANTDISHINQLIKTQVSTLLNYCDNDLCLTSWHELKLNKHLNNKNHFEAAVSKLGKHYFLQLRDVSRHKVLNKELSLLATIDPLTGLANRQVFEDRLTEALKRAQRSKEPLAFILLDLDGFKQINDSLGHQAGDKLLVMLAQRLNKMVRKTDTLARLGGDEFCIIFENVSCEDALKCKLREIAADLAKPLTIMGQTLCCKASIGACISNGEFDEAEIYKRADAAMYQAKNALRGSIKVHQQTEQFNQHTSISEQLDQDIDYSQFELFFQPSINIKNQQVCSIEALLRWRENGKACLPKQFIKVMESSGHFAEIESWVVHEACRCRKTWQQQKLVKDSIPITINISKSFFYYPGFIKLLHHEINRFGLKPNMIELDIKESCLLEGMKKSNKILNDLNQLGVQIALDQFGTGMSSLSMLHHQPISRVKLDKSLISKGKANNWQLINGIIKAARPLKVKVVAEGVESEVVMRKLKSERCDAIQGYLVSRPTKLKNLEQFIRGQVTVN